jgi:hypothetical protein
MAIQVPPSGHIDMTWFDAPALTPNARIDKAVEVIGNLGRPLTLAEVEHYGGFAARDKMHELLPVAVGRGRLVTVQQDGDEVFGLPA